MTMFNMTGGISDEQQAAFTVSQRMEGYPRIGQRVIEILYAYILYVSYHFISITKPGADSDDTPTSVQKYKKRAV